MELYVYVTIRFAKMPESICKITLITQRVSSRASHIFRPSIHLRRIHQCLITIVPPGVMYVMYITVCCTWP